MLTILYLICLDGVSDHPLWYDRTAVRYWGIENVVNNVVFDIQMPLFFSFISSCTNSIWVSMIHMKIQDIYFGALLSSSRGKLFHLIFYHAFVSMIPTLRFRKLILVILSSSSRGIVPYNFASIRPWFYLF